MIFGDLQDEAKEFFIQAKDSNSNHDDIQLALAGSSSSSTSLLSASNAEQRMIQKLLHTKNSRENGSTSSEQQSFEWSSSYFLRLERLPNSHVSAGLASKILFAGKAVLMLQQSQFHQSAVHKEESFTHRKFDQRSVFHYLSQGYTFHEKKPPTADTDSEDEDEDDEEDDDQGKDEEITSLEDEKDRKPSKKEGKDAEQSALLIGFTRQEIESFDREFHELLTHSTQLVPKLELLINTMYDLISNRLWNFMKESYGFLHYLQIIRNTYLMGKGEFFQNILDDLYLLTFDASYLPAAINAATAPVHAATAPPQTPVGTSSSSLEEMDEILNWKILRNATKLIGLDDDEMIHILTLKIDLNTIVVPKFTEQNIHYFTQTGFAQCEYPSTTSSSSSSSNKGKSRLAENIYEPLNILFNTRSAPKLSNLFMKLWQEKNSLQSVYLHNTLNNPWNPLHSTLSSRSSAMKGKLVPEPVYLNGSLWFNDTKFVQKGFYHTINFATSWININRFLTVLHPYFQSQAARNQKNWPRFSASLTESAANKFEIVDGRQTDLLLGSIATCLQNDPRTVHCNGKGELSRDIHSSIMVGVSFHGKLLR